MLCLSRKRGESVVLGNNVEVYVVEIRGDKVRLGVRAPEAIPVHRHEVHAAIKRGGHFVPDLVPAQPLQNTLTGA